MFDSTRKLYAQLATALGVEAIPADERGIVQLEVGDEGRVALVPEDPYTLMLMAPSLALPGKLDSGSQLWLLRRNFHDSPLAPFRIGCDKAGTLVVWGRVPTEGLSGQALADLIDAVATEAALIRDELASGGDEAEADADDAGEP
jgi:hypothetical protein